MLKVLHIITGLDNGGAEGVLFRLCSHDTKYRHIVLSLSSIGKYGPLLLEKGIEVHALGMRPYFLSPFAFFSLIKFIHIHKPDIVQTWMYHADLLGGIASRIAGIKNLCWNIRHTIDLDKSKRTTLWIAKILAKVSWWLPSLIIVCSKNSIDVHKALGYDYSKMSFIPNGYDLSHFKPRPKDAAVLRFNLGYSSEMPVIGMVGRYAPQKDHANLLHALAILKSRRIVIRCLLLGNKIDIRNTQLIELIKNLKLKDIVVLLDRQNDVATVMSALDVHILPSSFGEAFPNVVAESMACETPCIVTDVGDSANIVGHTGWVVPPRNAQALADTIEHVMLAHKNKTIWTQRKINARNRIEQKFSLDNMIKNYHTAWDKTRL